MKTIIEIGAHSGVETTLFLQDITAQVYAFEPNQLRFKNLLRLSYNYPRLHVLPFAVDWGDNQEPLFHDEDDSNDSLNPMGNKFSGKKFTLTWTMRLDTFVELYDISTIDYLRIDAPFSEEACLNSLGDRSSILEKGRVKCYGHKDEVLTWLYDNNFSFKQDTLSNCVTHPEIAFWR